MSSEYSKEDLQYLAETFIEDLRELEDGTSTTTWKLLDRYHYERDEFDKEDLLEIHAALIRAAKANHITLDMSAHVNKAEGLPYNLDFVVRNKKAQIKCPRCGSLNTARILYGLPAYSDELAKKAKEGKIILGGCIVDGILMNGEYVDTDPARHCNDCKKKFGTPPLIITKDRSSAEDYRDIVTSIEFSDGGYFGGHTDIKITKNENGALVSVLMARHGIIPPEDRQITAARWNRILNELYSHMYLHEWKKNYCDPYVLDGEDWMLEIKLTGGRERHYNGINDFPAYWKELKKLFQPYMPKRDKTTATE